MKNQKKEESKSKGSSKQSSSKTPISRDRKSNPSNQNRSARQQQSESEPNLQDIKPKHEYDYSSFWDRFFLKLKSWSQKVTPFGETALTPEFMSFLNLELKESLLNFNLCSKEILGNTENYPKIIEELTKENPIYPELILRGGKILDYNELDDLFREYSTKPRSRIPIEFVYIPLHSLFRKLYFLYPYQNSYKKALETGYEILEKIEKKASVIYKTKKKQVLKNHYFIFEKAFDKIYLAVLRKNDKNIPMGSQYMDIFLEIKNDERIGSLKSFQYVENIPLKDETKVDQSEGVEEEVEEEVKEEKEEILPILKQGNELLLQTTLENLRKKHDTKKDFHEIPTTDKAFITYLLFKEFDYEYSMILTSKKIIVNSTNVKGLKTDYRSKLATIYEQTRASLDLFESYVESLKEYEKAKSTPLANYIEQSKKMTAADQKKNVQSRNFRASVKDYMGKVTALLNIFLEDMEKEKLIISNSEEILNFENVESKKKLNKKKVKDAIFDCCAYCIALLEKLSDSGDLYGAGISMTPEQMKRSFNIDVLGSDTDSPESEKSELSDIA